MDDPQRARLSYTQPSEALVVRNQSKPLSLASPRMHARFVPRCRSLYVGRPVRSFFATWPSLPSPYPRFPLSRSRSSQKLPRSDNNIEVAPLWVGALALARSLGRPTPFRERNLKEGANAVRFTRLAAAAANRAKVTTGFFHPACSPLTVDLAFVHCTSCQSI